MMADYLRSRLPCFRPSQTLTLAWVIKDFRVERLAQAAGQPPEAVPALVAFRDGLVERLVDLAKP